MFYETMFPLNPIQPSSPCMGFWVIYLPFLASFTSFITQELGYYEKSIEPDILRWAGCVCVCACVCKKECSS